MTVLARAVAWLLARLLLLCSPSRSVESALGDLFEENREVRSRSSVVSATAWLVRESISLVAGTWQESLRVRFGRRTHGGGPRDGTKDRQSPRLSRPFFADQLASDVRRALHTLRRAPGFTAATGVTLALGIGANAAIFSVLDAVLFRPLPYPQSERIVRITGPHGQAFTRFGGPERFSFQPPELAESRTFEGTALFTSGGLNLGVEPAERLPGAAVTAGFFDVLGASPIVGRTFTSTDLQQTQQFAVISHRLWRRRFDGDASVVGRSIVLNGQPFTVTGVMPPRVEFPDASEIWIASGGDPQVGGNPNTTTFIARLANGVTRAQARENVARLVDPSLSPETDPARFRVVSLRDALVGEIRPVLIMIAAAAALVLAVACANAANLLLARVVAREREFAARRALGASLAQLVRQVLSESLVLSLGAAVVAIPAAVWTLEGMRTFLPATVHGAPDIALNGRVVVATAAVAVLTALAFGLAPAFSFRGQRWVDVLHGTPAATIDPFWRRFRSALVVAQITIALVLLAGAATLVGTVGRLMAVDLGARGERALVVEVTLPLAKYGLVSDDAVRQFYESFAAGLRAIPGVDEAGATDQFPGRAAALIVGHSIGVTDATTPTDPTNRYASRVSATPGYFSAAGIDLLAGRAFSPHDGPDAPRVVVVSEGFARALGLSPRQMVGRQVNVGRWAGRDIVGVVADVRLGGPESPLRPAIYEPVAQASNLGIGPMQVVFRGRGDPRQLIPALRRAAARIDPGLPLYDIRTFDEIRATHFAERRFAMTTMTVFGALAFVLAVVGLYGVVSYLVRLRTQEIGIRMAIGASPARVRREVLTGGLLHAACGVAAGAACALVASRLIAATIPGFGSVEPITLALLASAIFAVAGAATWLPARRATRVDPALSLRAE